MARKVSNFSDLVQRVTASCLLYPLAGVQEDDYDDVAEEYEEEEDVDLEDEFEWRWWRSSGGWDFSGRGLGVAAVAVEEYGEWGRRRR
ncbi:hypothetical protein CASFOL_030731 [Castilleja foliolosa]|uniref:Uncharacterized protein n=1 Tax=Castilleja foliolosa TaxID=1961234 RepID=A0ABD3C950_9LAMI